MCAYIYVYIYICIFAYTNICPHVNIKAVLFVLFQHVYIMLCMYIHVYPYINIFIYICIYKHRLICWCIRLSKSLHAYKSIYLSAHTHTHTHTHKYIYICMYILHCRTQFKNWPCVASCSWWRDWVNKLFSLSLSLSLFIYIYIYIYIRRCL